MLLQITHLKAPWPAGAKVGDVVELTSVPAWAKGKCVPAPEGDEPTVAFLLAVEPVELSPTRDLAAELAETEGKLAEANEVIKSQKEALNDCRQACIDAEAALAAQAKAEGEVVELRQKLADAEATMIIATLTGDGSGVALPPIDPLPVIDEPKPKAKK